MCEKRKLKYSIDDMQQVAVAHGGLCLSNEYNGSVIKLKWECSDKHIWEASPDSIKKGSWCPYCAKVKKLTIDDMQQIALEKGGRCLSTEYINTSTKLIWQCNEQHTWEARPINVKQGHWCPYCSGNAKLTIENMQQIAFEKGGLCLSTNYINNNTKLQWQCEFGHIWEAIPRSIKNGIWCPHCSLKILTIEEMQQIAIKRGGLCLSTQYINCETKLQWQCFENHTWEATPSHIKNGTWCPYCFGNVYKTIEEMHKLAHHRNGQCLSKQYLGMHTKLQWQCFENHRWEAVPNNIKNGTWCPYCNINFNEEYCREYLNKLFKIKFITCRPLWLKNPETNYLLQLDGYCEQLDLAFEYNGEQHYYPIKFDQNISDEEATVELTKRQKRDKIKIQLCKENNTKLIIIPYWENKNIEEFILSQLKILEIDV